MLIQYWNHKQESKEQFHKETKKLLRSINKSLSLNADIRSNKAGSASLGEVTLHANNIYIQMGGLYPDQVLIRECTNKKDFSGGRNTFCNNDKESILNHLAHYFNIK